VLPSPHWLATLSPGFAGKQIGTKSWVGVSKGWFEKTGVCEKQECATAGLRKEVYEGGRRNVQGSV
jgi:hypothetical protein